MRPLNRKLVRDLLAMKGQAFAIAMVVAAGVAMFVMYLSNFDSLRRTQQAYYERQRFGDVFASLKRAPLSLQDRIAAIPGVADTDARVVAMVTLDVKGLDVSSATLDQLLAVDPEQWRKEMASIGEYFAEFGDRLPAELKVEHQKVLSALG